MEGIPGRHGLTQERVESYLRYRVEILRFIEQRFRQAFASSTGDRVLLPWHAGPQ